MLLSQSKSNQTSADSFLPMHSYSNQKQTQSCDQCGLTFDTLPQMLNHRKKFCQNSGYDNLTGLLMKQTGKNDLKVDYKLKSEQLLKKEQSLKYNSNQMKHYGQYSLSKIKYDSSQNQPVNKRSLLLYDDLMQIQKHQNSLQSVRPYQIQPNSSTANPHNNQQNANFFSSRKQSQNFANSKSGSTFSYRLNDQNFTDKLPSNIQYLQSLLLKNQQSISPATKSHIRQRKPITKQFLQDEPTPNIVQYKNNPASIEFGHSIQKPSLLNKSNASIANMPTAQKITYAKYKLDELESIKELYLKNGGQSKEFKNNVQKMIFFYHNLLKDCLNPPLDESRLSLLSRPETPIMKLNGLSTDGLQNVQKNDMKMTSARPGYNTASKQLNIPQNINMNSPQAYQVPIAPGINPFGFPSHFTDPNAMMAQNYAHMYHTKVMEEALRSKSQENKKLIEVLIGEIKRDKFPQQNKEQQLPNDQSQKYRFANQVIPTKSSQDRILKLLQEEELDEMVLLSKLPVPLQDQKIQSLIKNSELRFRMEKEVLKQKLQRLAWQEKIQSREDERQVKNHEWVRSKNKDVLGSQMHQYLEDFRDEFRHSPPNQ